MDTRAKVETLLLKAETQSDAEIRTLVEKSLVLENEGREELANGFRLRRSLGLRAEFGLKHVDEKYGDIFRSHYVWHAHLFAEVDEKTFEQWLAVGVAGAGTKKFCLNTIRSKAQRVRTAKKRAANRATILSAQGIEIYEAAIANIVDLKLGTPAAIITDPPYEEQHIPRWAELIKFADRVLAERGWLVAMSGQRWLPRTLAAMTEAAVGTSMRYVWTLAMLTPGQTCTAWIGERNPLSPEWKPIFVYAKGEPALWPGVDWDGAKFLAEGFRDVVVSEGNDKRYHKWGQPVNVLKRLVEEFTAPGTLVVDPFLGGGTTAVVARDLGRAFEGFDIDSKAVTDSIQRVFETETLFNAR